MDLNNSGIQYRDDMPNPETVLGISMVESNPANPKFQNPDGSFNPHVTLRNEKDKEGNERGILSVGRFQLASHVIPELLDQGFGDGLLSPLEQKLLRSGTFEEKKGVMITRAREIDMMAMKRLGKDHNRLQYDNPIVEGHHWQAPKRTQEAVKAVTGGASWSDFQAKHGKKGAALLVMNEIEKTAPQYIKDRMTTYRNNIDQLVGPQGVQMASLDPYTQQLMSDMYGLSPTSDVDVAQMTQETIGNALEAQDLDQAMVESDDPGILMAGLEKAVDMLAIPSDKTRAFLSEKSGLDVPVESMEKGRVTSREFILAVAPEMESFLNIESLPEWDDNKPIMENVFQTLQAVNENVASTITEVGVDLATDPLSFISAGFNTMSKAVKTTYQAITKIGEARAGKAIEKKMTEAKKEYDQVVKAEKAIKPDDSLKTSQQLMAEKIGVTLKTGVDPVTDFNSVAPQIQGDVLARIDARAAELASGTHRTLEQARSEAARKIAEDGLGMTVDQARKLFPNAPVNDTQFAVWAQTNVTVTKSMMDVAKEWKAAAQTGQADQAKALKDKFFQLYEAHRQVSMANDSGLSAAGRVMRFSQEPTEVGGQLFKMEKLDARIEKELVKAGGNGDLFIEGLAAIEDPMKIAKVTQKLAQPGMFGLYRELLVNELLSGPATHILNITTGISSLTYAGLQRTAGTLISNPLGRNAKKADPRDAANYFIGAFSAIPEAMLALAKMPFDKQQSVNKLLASRENKIAQDKASRVFTGGTPKATDGPMMTFMRQLGAGIGSVANTPITALMMTDRGLRHIMANAELRYLASQMADERLSKMKNLTNAEKVKKRKEIIQDVVNNPESAGPLLKQALDHADEGIFTERLKGFQAHIEQARSASKLAQAALPFYKAIMNIGNYEFRRMPGVQLFSQEFRSQLTSSDPLVKQAAYGNLAVGTSFATMGWMMAGNGTTIGKAPSDPKQAAMMKDLGIEPYSFVWDTDDDGVPDKWVSYKNWGPFGTILGTAANLQQMRGYASEEEWNTLVGHFIVGTTELILDKTIAENVHQVGDTVFKFMANPEKLSATIDRQMLTYSLLNPKILEYAQRSVDPVIRDKEGFYEQMIARTPWGSDKLPSQRNILGEDLYIGFLDPKTTDVIERSVMGLVGTVAAGKKLSQRQQDALFIMQPLLDEGITISKPEREIGSLVLSKPHMDYMNDVFYRGDGVIPTMLIEDLDVVYRDWLRYKGTLDVPEIQRMLMEGGLTPEQVENMSPNKVLQANVNKLVSDRKETALSALVEKFGDEVGDRILAEKMKSGYIKDQTRNPAVTSPGKRKIDDLIQQSQPEESGDAIQNILNVPNKVQQRLQFQIGG